MLEVWNGDMYNIVEDGALNELISDLLTQKKGTSEDDLLEKASMSL